MTTSNSKSNSDLAAPTRPSTTNQALQQDWEDLGKMDPLWAVLSDPSKKNNKWDEAEFYQTGKVFIAQMLQKAKALGAPQSQLRALDFGCGAGRLSLALTEHFEHTVGVDISSAMLEKSRAQAKKMGLSESTCQFVHNTEPNLKVFADNSFDYVGTYIVLQHIPDQAVVENYIREFVRILKPGGLLFFQIPTRLALKNRIQLRRRAYSLLRKIGVPQSVLFNQLGLHPIFYNYTPSARVAELLSQCRILNVMDESAAGNAVTSSTYFVTK